MCNKHDRAPLVLRLGSICMPSHLASWCTAAWRWDQHGSRPGQHGRGRSKGCSRADGRALSQPERKKHARLHTVLHHWYHEIHVLSDHTAVPAGMPAGACKPCTISGDNEGSSEQRMAAASLGHAFVCAIREWESQLLHPGVSSRGQPIAITWTEHAALSQHMLLLSWSRKVLQPHLCRNNHFWAAPYDVRTSAGYAQNRPFGGRATYDTSNRYYPNRQLLEPNAALSQAARKALRHQKGLNTRTAAAKLQSCVTHHVEHCTQAVTAPTTRTTPSGTPAAASVYRVLADQSQVSGPSLQSPPAP